MLPKTPSRSRTPVGPRRVPNRNPCPSTLTRPFVEKWRRETLALDPCFSTKDTTLDLESIARQTFQHHHHSIYDLYPNIAILFGLVRYIPAETVPYGHKGPICWIEGDWPPDGDAEDADEVPREGIQPHARKDCCGPCIPAFLYSRSDLSCPNATGRKELTLVYKYDLWPDPVKKEDACVDSCILYACWSCFTHGDSRCGIMDRILTKRTDSAGNAEIGQSQTPRPGPVHPTSSLSPPPPLPTPLPKPKRSHDATEALGHGPKKPRRSPTLGSSVAQSSLKVPPPTSGNSRATSVPLRQPGLKPLWLKGNSNAVTDPFFREPLPPRSTSATVATEATINNAQNPEFGLPTQREGSLGPQRHVSDPNRPGRAFMRDLMEGKIPKGTASDVNTAPIYPSIPPSPPHPIKEASPMPDTTDNSQFTPMSKLSVTTETITAINSALTSLRTGFTSSSTESRETITALLRRLDEDDANQSALLETIQDLSIRLKDAVEANQEVWREVRAQRNLHRLQVASLEGKVDEMRMNMTEKDANIKDLESQIAFSAQQTEKLKRQCELADQLWMSGKRDREDARRERDEALREAAKQREMCQRAVEAAEDIHREMKEIEDLYAKSQSQLEEFRPQSHRPDDTLGTAKLSNTVKLGGDASLGGLSPTTGAGGPGNSSRQPVGSASGPPASNLRSNHEQGNKGDGVLPDDSATWKSTVRGIGVGVNRTGNMDFQSEGSKSGTAHPPRVSMAEGSMTTPKDDGGDDGDSLSEFLNNSQTDLRMPGYF